MDAKNGMALTAVFRSFHVRAGRVTETGLELLQAAGYCEFVVAVQEINVGHDFCHRVTETQRKEKTLCLWVFVANSS